MKKVIFFLVLCNFFMHLANSQNVYLVENKGLIYVDSNIVKNTAFVYSKAV